jgi:hypothetical protein
MSWACVPLDELETHLVEATASGPRDPRSNRSKKRTGPKLLTGGNPQIPKSEATASCRTTSQPSPV